ncbi:MAG: DNA-binding protein [Rhodospirillales bacterium 20-64-7]|nr:MAG: DNA-binding protein [Rhodospirillales bacterium 20-64-7]HQT76870.1 OB-fold domain-containing protein [Rhodopila sp.]
MAYVARKIPFVGTPETNPETKPFFDGSAAGKLMIRRCTKCKKAHWYPRSLCPYCFGECEWEQASGKGTIYTFSVMERGNPPYAIGYVTLAEGPKMLTNFVDCELKDLKIGQDVTVTFVQTENDGPTMPMFKPV